MTTKPQHYTNRAANDLAVFTLVVWLLCTAVGALGLLLPYARPLPPAPPEEPVLAQSSPVELIAQPTPPPDTPRPSVNPLTPPPPPEAMTPPPVAQALAVAQPSPVIAFALPVEGPTRVVEIKRAEYVRPAVTNASVVAVAPPTSVPPQTLTFGEGEGRQPAPEYPRLSARQGQEGVVVIRLSVGLDGGVMSAEVVRASPWPLLNQAALKVVRDRWHFRNGPVRTYEVSIRFELAK